VTLALAGSILSLFRYDVAFVVPCNGACSLLGFQGVLPNEDLLGVSLALTIPFAYIGFRGRGRVWLSLYVAAMTVATGSKTAVVGALASILLLSIVRPRLDARVSRRWAGITVSALLAAALVSAVVPLHRWSPTSLSDRGQLWSVARQYISRSPWVGYGPDRWSQLASSSEIPLSGERSAHNLWMDVLFASGAIGAILLGVMLAVMVRSSGRARVAVCVTLITVLLLGTAEGTWQIGAFDTMSFSLLAAILLGDPEGFSRSGRPTHAGRAVADGRSLRVESFHATDDRVGAGLEVPGSSPV
jgi:hypothetical protein